MPTYEFSCPYCGTVESLCIKMNRIQDTKVKCAKCASEMKRVWNNAAIVWKGGSPQQKRDKELAEEKFNPGGV